MKLEEFHYDLPENLIAQVPVSPRDSSRLLVLDRETGKIVHDHFYNFLNYLGENDILVFNNSKVFSARLLGEKEKTGGKVEILLIRKQGDGNWLCIGRNLRVNDEIEFKGGELNAMVLEKKDQEYIVKFDHSGGDFFGLLEKIGQTPLPPYIAKSQKREDIDDKTLYQTVYAKEIGSVAAPTAGLHFTNSLMKEIKKKGVETLELTLHVGLGTFLPVKSEEIENHQMHEEYYEINSESYEKIIQAKKSGRKIIAVGTTSARVLETIFRTSKFESLNSNLSGWTNIFIYPGYEFKCVDALLTNFHLPKSTLLLLVSALAGADNIRKAYKEAIKENYRFYSYGDAMLINYHTSPRG